MHMGNDIRPLAAHTSCHLASTDCEPKRFLSYKDWNHIRSVEFSHGQPGLCRPLDQGLTKFLAVQILRCPLMTSEDTWVS